MYCVTEAQQTDPQWWSQANSNVTTFCFGFLWSWCFPLLSTHVNLTLMYQL